MKHLIEQRISAKAAKLVGSVYFLLLGLTNFVATFIYAEVKPLDSLTAVICALPFLIRKKMLLLVFGAVAAIISAYGAFACLIFSVNPQVQTSKIAFLMGFLLTGSALVSSLLLIIAGTSNENVKPNLHV
ncbi:MAG: hypothetical protein INR73_00335 [Williamsia sp.]|nr:hypothetical protein [Williamsia sp.]